MALPMDGGISLSTTTGLAGRNGRLGKFSNGELMGKKLLNLSQLHHSKASGNSNGRFVCMSVLTNNVAAETKLRDLDLERRDPRTVAAIILGGGAGTRLFPLTKRRAKPAVPIGGAYRLIDVPMSNCINSGINKIYILTQYNSASLNRHLARAYNFGNGISFGDGFVEALAATQTPGEMGKQWFQGTADAVRQFHWLFEDARSREIEDIIILSGDHLYRMDYMDFIQNHRESGADITLSCLPMDDSRASDFGLMKIDSKGRVLSFSEKPKGNNLKAMEVDTTVLGLSREEAKKKPYIASMGVYVFKKEILLNLLRWRFPTANDFGSEIIPASANEFFIKAYLFNDYWEDIGTIKSFFEANLALTSQTSSFSFYDAAKPMYTSRRNLPPSQIDKSKIIDSIVSHGSFLNNCIVEHSVVGIRSRINSSVYLKDTVMLGADYYETDEEVAALLTEGRVPLGIGENSKVSGCIIDKNARIGKNVVIANSEGIQEADRSSEGFYIRSGITIVLKNSTIKDGPSAKLPFIDFEGAHTVSLPLAQEIATSNSLTPIFISPSSSSNYRHDFIFEEEEEDEDMCSICLEPFSSNDPATVTNCKHDYHLQCILEWSQRSKECPICWQLLVLKDPASQELLAAVGIERNARGRRTSSSSSAFARIPSEDSDSDDLSYAEDSDFNEHIMQHLTAAALSRARHFSRRQRHRSSGMDPSRFHVFSASSDNSNIQQTYTTTSVESHSSSNPTSPDSDTQRDIESTDIGFQPTTYVLSPPVDTGSNIRDDRHSPLRPGYPLRLLNLALRVFASHTLPGSPQRSRPSELLSFSETLKSKFSAASARYKESLTKSTRGFKEKLLARNNSVKELSKEVQREVSAGIAGVARMVERLDPTSKNSGNSSPVSGRAEGTSNVSQNGKGVIKLPDAVNLESTHGTSSNSHTHIPGSLSSSTGRVEVTRVKDVLRFHGDEI
ncbi:hypothetical protein IFM89_017496 [Coptis chinensis]|uniref:Glucose-1-phosphate adenylyltransferase n=1 Tax=Coptis chinensis TaxID=261450 RepID=A0A835HW42_9MAGN|nr:hypothetical protein IFM89_017496 [Coptis chinensis]